MVIYFLYTPSAIYSLIFFSIQPFSNSLFLGPKEACSKIRLPSGKCCVFPFEYNGRQYNECTVDGSTVRPWCATTSNYTQDREWEYCECKRCSVLVFLIGTFPFLWLFFLSKNDIHLKASVHGDHWQKNPFIPYGSSSSVPGFSFWSIIIKMVNFILVSIQRIPTGSSSVVFALTFYSSLQFNVWMFFFVSFLFCFLSKENLASMFF